MIACQDIVIRVCTVMEFSALKMENSTNICMIIFGSTSKKISQYDVPEAFFRI